MKAQKSCFAIVLWLAGMLSASASDPRISEGIYIKAPNPDAGDLFGRKTSLSGDTLVVGVPGEDSDGSSQLDNSLENAGAVYVYHRTDGEWGLQAYLKAPVPEAGALFGASVSVSGDRLAIGAPGEAIRAEDPDQLNGGAVYIYERSGSQWGYQARLRADPDTVPPHRGTISGQTGAFGNSVAIDGDRVAFGLPQWVDGAVYVFAYSGSEWVQEWHNAVYYHEGTDYGAQVAMSGSTLVVGVRMYERVGGEWTYVRAFYVPGELGHGFGDPPVSISDGTLVSGNVGFYGGVDVNKQVGGSWLAASHAFIGPSFETASLFPVSNVGVSGNVVVAGAEEASGEYIGCVFLPQRDGWSDAIILRRPEDGYIDSSSSFGGQVAIDGTTLVVSDTMDDGNGTGVGATSTESLPNSGAVYVFTLQPAIIYVDSGAADGGDGTSWESAFKQLHTAVDAGGGSPVETTEIWVARGVYKPELAEVSQDSTFAVAPGVSVYGGFRGDETVRGQRDPLQNVTILSGDVDGNDVNFDGNSIAESHADAFGTNSRHVLTMLPGAELARVDGFTITAGNASGGDAQSDGGGLYAAGANFELANCKFTGNQATRDGGAMYGVDSVAKIDKCEFYSNRAGDDGGVFYTYNSQTDIARSVFQGNVALDRGAALYFSGTPGTVSDSLISGNAAAAQGGAIYVKRNSLLSIVNCTIAGNQASSGSGIFSEPVAGTMSEIILRNTVIWSNAATPINFGDAGVPATFVEISNSLVEGEDLASYGNDNLDGADDPSFIAPLPPGSAQLGGEYRVTASSPLFGAGDDAFALSVFDLVGNIRIENGIEIGAYEVAAVPSFASRYPGVAPSGDENGNGLSNLMDYALGGEPPVMNGNELTVVRRNGAVDVSLTLEASPQLESGWVEFVTLTEQVDYRVVSTTDLGDGLEEKVYELLGGARVFFRLKVSYFR